MNIAETVKTLEASKRQLFSTEDLKKLLKIRRDNTLYKTLERLSKVGLLRRLSKGKYAYWAREPETFQIANFLCAPSYVSLESALNFHGVLIQTPYRITSVTPLRSKTLSASGQEYLYAHFSPQFYFGYVKEKTFLMATKEKALLDQLYLVSKGLRSIDVKELDLSHLDKAKLLSFARKIGKRHLLNFVKGLVT